MKTNKGLIIPIHILEKASGISEKILKNDIHNSRLRMHEEGFIWYHDALVYVYEKWNEGKIEMYPPYSDEPNHSFAARVLSIMDDEITAKNLSIEWKEKL